MTVASLAWALVPVACTGLAAILARDLRDAGPEGRPRGLAAIGRQPGRVTFSVLLVVAYLTLPLGWAVGALPAATLLAWLTAPLAMRVGDTVSHQEGAAVAPAVAGTIRLHLLFGVLLALGLLSPV
ncbi:MAG TPA: hypothetical protein VMJ92_03100 [Candidatus Limnocylindrales bacterium]|nr:hypothetical protein [Candidatus Limnocylindrales bacterium]